MNKTVISLFFLSRNVPPKADRANVHCYHKADIFQVQKSRLERTALLPIPATGEIPHQRHNIG